MVNIALFLLITIILENLLVGFLVKGFSRKKILLVITAANLITNPLLNVTIMMNYLQIHSNFLNNIVIMELGVVIIETFIFSRNFKLNFLKGTGLSLLLNTFSFVAGYILLIFIVGFLSYLPTPFS